MQAALSWIVSMMPLPSEHDGLRTARRLAVAVSSTGFNQSAFLVLMPVIVAQGGFGIGQVGLAAILGTLAFLIASPLWGWAGAMIGARRLFPVLAAIMVAAQIPLAGLLLGWPGIGEFSLALLVASRVVYGVGSAGVMPQAQAAIIRATAPEARPGALAVLSAGLGLGRILGSLVTALAAASPWVAPLALVASPLTLLAAPAAPTGAPPPRERVRLPGRALPLVAIGFSTTLAFGAVQTTLALLLQNRLHLTPEAAAGLMGILYALTAAGMIAVQVTVVPRLGARLGRNLRVGALGLACGTALIATTAHAVAIAAGLIVAGAGIALATPAYTAWLAARSGAEPAGNAGWLASAHVLGQGCGALAGALAFEAWPPLPFLLAAGIGLGIAAASTAIAAPDEAAIKPAAHGRAS
jgi:MFS family permease